MTARNDEGAWWEDNDRQAELSNQLLSIRKGISWCQIPLWGIFLFLVLSRDEAASSRFQENAGDLLVGAVLWGAAWVLWKIGVASWHGISDALKRS